MTRADEKPPRITGRSASRARGEAADHLLRYKGWTDNGIPTRKRLEELDLAYVADDLEKRGILNGQGQKIVKRIKIDADKCNGCRGCEIICSAIHAQPKFSSVNPPGPASG